MDGYDVAQICINGHVINDSSRRYPQFNAKFCTKCGSPTITQCQACHIPIRGEYHSDGVISVGGPEPKAPLYCHECGKSYPWTDAVLKAAHELADTAVDLTNEERANLKEDISDLIRDSPRAPAAAYRANTLATKAGIKDLLINLFSNIASDTLIKLTRGW